MDIETILEELERLTEEFPRAALEAAIAQREAITPYLLQEIEETARDLKSLALDYEYMRHLYAFYLLAQFRETRAYPLIVAFFSQPGEAASDAVGDFLTESLGQVLASVSGGDMTLMQQMVENPALYDFTRAAALSGLVCLVANDLQPRDVVVAYFRSLFQGKLERDYSFTWDALVNCAVELYPEELMPEIRQAFTDNLIDGLMFRDFSEVEASLPAGKDAALADLRENRHYRLIEDTIGEIESWACFQPEMEPEPFPAPAYTPPPVTLSPIPLYTPPPPPQTPWITSQKVGRNDPCPCGSGKKYKQCCLKKGQTPTPPPPPATPKRPPQREEGQFKIGDNVRVKPGVQDVDFGDDLGGWQGRITDILPDGTLMLAWDSLTLRAIPPETIIASEEAGLGWDTYGLDAADVEPASARDTPADVARALAELEQQHHWSWLGEEGEITRQVLAGLNPDDDYALVAAWETYLQAHLTFPFEAVIDEYQERGPLQSGDRVRVHGITDADDHYGIIINLRRGQEKFAFPLCDLAALDTASANHAIIHNYRVWFANR